MSSVLDRARFQFKRISLIVVKGNINILIVQ